MEGCFNEIFCTLFWKIVPLYIIIFLGFIAGRFLKIDRKSIASLLFYIIIPIVFFDFALHIKMQPEYFLLPVLFFLISGGLSFSCLKLSRMIWREGALPNVLGFSAGTGNTGYFGLPVALMLFDSQTVAVYMMMNLGFSLFDYTFGAYIMARGQHSSRDAIIQVSRLPMIYAFLLGFFLNINFSLELPYELKEITEKMRSTYIVLGMMIVGLGMSTVSSLKPDYKFLGVMLSAKFIGTPLLIGCLVYLDKNYYQLFSHDIHKAMMLMSFVPPAANTVVFASLHNAHPEEAATGIMLGTIIALLYLPAAVALFF